MMCNMTLVTVLEVTSTHLTSVSCRNQPLPSQLRSWSVCGGAGCLSWFGGVKVVFGDMTHIIRPLENLRRCGTSKKAPV